MSAPEELIGLRTKIKRVQVKFGNSTSATKLWHFVQGPELNTFPVPLNDAVPQFLQDCGRSAGAVEERLAMIGERKRNHAAACQPAIDLAEHDPVRQR